jgi:hypothetical protein
MKDLLPVLEQVARLSRSLLIIAEWECLDEVRRSQEAWRALPRAVVDHAEALATEREDQSSA